MPLTPQQTRLIHIAAKQVGLEDAAYRMLLKNVTKQTSSKELTQPEFEDMMAVLEDLGFRDAKSDDADYWRRKVRDRQQHGNSRMVHLIRQLAAGSRYSLDAMCLRLSGGRTDQPEQLRPREAWNLIEAYKASGQRSAISSQHNNQQSTFNNRRTEDANGQLSLPI